MKKEIQGKKENEDKESGKRLKYSTQADCFHAALEITVDSDLLCPSANSELLAT